MSPIDPETKWNANFKCTNFNHAETHKIIIPWLNLCMHACLRTGWQKNIVQHKLIPSMHCRAGVFIMFEKPSWVLFLLRNKHTRQTMQKARLCRDSDACQLTGAFCLYESHAAAGLSDQTCDLSEPAHVKVAMCTTQPIKKSKACQSPWLIMDNIMCACVLGFISWIGMHNMSFWCFSSFVMCTIHCLGSESS